MKATHIALPMLSALCLAGTAVAKEEPSAPAPATYMGKVDPGAFRETPLEYKKKGVTVNPAAVRLITPGMDKFSIYNLIGPPHFGEGITRRWNYVLFFPVTPGSTERIRCRMEIRFGRKRTDGYNIAVSEVVWKEQACADRVVAAS
ncbi:outer membrane protein assembly factor BamE domain-containing protein [Sphingomonas sp. MS122]|uniref:outer membrane protein assembly factor BamE domain-containing protein n=1 Tax=Sphingomonas sp. MS122 TaxID=3412683 RepID=UPI003C300084